MSVCLSFLSLSSFRGGFPKEMDSTFFSVCKMTNEMNKNRKRERESERGVPLRSRKSNLIKG